jgi:dolichyl-phosphate-mannose--protein O-mannosyl transferase
VDEVKCGDIIRLEHALTKKNLHTHDIRAPLSGKQEISCFGSDGDGDTGKSTIIYLELFI